MALTVQQEQEIVQAFLSNEYTRNEIMALFNTSAGTINMITNKHGLSYTRQGSNERGKGVWIQSERLPVSVAPEPAQRILPDWLREDDLSDDAMQQSLNRANELLGQASKRIAELEQQSQRDTATITALRQECTSLRTDAQSWRDYKSTRNARERRESAALLQRQSDQLEAQLKRS